MARERRHRRAPQITFGPYDPNLKPAQRSRKWRWWAGGGLGLVVLLGVGLWLGSSREKMVEPTTAVATRETATNAVAETQEEPVVPELPFGAVTGLNVGENVEVAARYGNVRIVANTPDYAREYFGKTAKRFRLDTNAWVSIATLPHTLTNMLCGVADVAMEADGFKADPASRRVLIQEGRTNDVTFALQPLPAIVAIDCKVTNAIAQIGDLKSATVDPLSVASLQPLTVTMTAPGYRAQTLKQGPIDPQTTNRQAVTLEREVGALRIEASVPTNALSFFQRLEKRIRISSNDWKTVKTLPYVVDRLPCEEVPVELVVTGFQMVGTARRAVRVIDAQTNSVFFELEPLPANLTISCNATDAVIQIGNLQSAIANSFPVPSLQPVTLTVSATGHVSQVVKLDPMDPGKAYRRSVKLQPVSAGVAAPVVVDGKPLTVDLGDGIKLEMVWVPPGDFMMGSPTSEPGRGGDESYHHVTISKGFWIGKYEVTQAQWARVMNENPSQFLDGKNPVEKVSYMDCSGFFRKLSLLKGVTNGVYRLPSEAEWEYACRAGTATAFSFGDRLESNEANFDGTYPYGGEGRGAYRRTTLPVGSFSANPWGLHDMHGNVSEWCLDTYQPYAKGHVTDPMFEQAGGRAYIIRGGNWSSSGKSCRSAQRDSGTFGSKGNMTGLRVIRVSP